LIIARNEKTVTQKEMTLLTGIVVEGHRVASGSSKDYPYGSLERQKPFFKAGGLDLDHFFTGTLNISIAPLRFKIINPAYTFCRISWTDLHPPEDFSFSPCRVRFFSKEYAGYIYFPHPETKIRHFQNPSLIEVITEKIPGIGYGDRIELLVNPEEVRIVE
jgi:hypothetical protein